MAEKTNKGMNFLFTPTLIEFEKTISLPMLSRKFQTHPFLFCLKYKNFFSIRERQTLSYFLLMITR